MTRTLTDIAAEARQVGQAAYDDAETRHPLSARIREAAEWPDYGSDGDFTPQQRERLRELADDAEAIEEVPADND